MEFLKKWFRNIRALLRGPQFSRREVVRYARSLRRISRVGFSFELGEWRYQLGGESFAEFGGAEILEMKKDFIKWKESNIL